MVVKTVYVKRLPPKDTLVRLADAISSCSPEEIQKPNPQPDLHYFEMYWYTPAVGGVQKNILRLLFPSYRDAVEEHNKMFNRLFGKTEGWIDEYYVPGFKAIHKECLISKENRKNLELWKSKYDQNMRKY